MYKGKHVGVYTADLVVADRLLIEVKCVDQFTTEHLAQCINYWKASGLNLALLINFRRAPRLQSQTLDWPCPISTSCSLKNSFRTNLIFPVPCEFISKDLPLCAVIRPAGPGQIDAKGAITSFIDNGLFIGEPAAFTNLLLELADEADARVRER